MCKLKLDVQPRKFLDKLSPDQYVRFKKALFTLQDNPFEGDIKKLEGKYIGYRKRVGVWRVLFVRNDDEKTLFVYKIIKRGDAY